MNELRLNVPIARGAKGADVKRIQEWLGLNGRLVSIDTDFGPATQSAVKLFQTAKGLAATGVVDAATWTALVAPLSAALADIPVAGKTAGALTALWAQQQLLSRPREIGGQNRGSWVRVYMDGNEGTNYPWCAGFVSFCLVRACATAWDRPSARLVALDSCCLPPRLTASASQIL